MPIRIAAGGSVSWSARTRMAGGKSVSILARMFISPSASSNALGVLSVEDDVGGATHRLSVAHDGVVTVSSGNSVGDNRSTSWTTTLPKGRWVWLACFIPSNYFGGGAVNASAWYDANGSWTALSTPSTGADPGGTISNTSGLAYVNNGLDAAALAGPVYAWAGADSPDTLAEMRAIGLGSTDPAAYTGLILSATLRDDYVDTFGTDAAGVATDCTMASVVGLPSWFGVRHHALHRFDFKGSSGTVSTKANGALAGGDLVVPATFTGGRGGTWPSGRSGIRVGNGMPDTSFVNMALESDTADAARPVMHAQSCTIVMVGWADSCNRSSAWSPVATNAGNDVMKTRLHGLLRPSVRSAAAGDIATDLRLPATPCVAIWRFGVGGVDFFVNGVKSAVTAPVLDISTTPTGTNLRIGALTTAASEMSDVVVQDVVTIEGEVVDADIEEITESLSSYHRCVTNPREVWVLDGSSSMAGAHDSAIIGGLESRLLKARPNSIIFTRGVGGNTLSQAIADYSVVGGWAAALYPNAKKSAILWWDSNAIEAGDTLVSIQTNYTSLVASYRADGYTNLIAVEVQPRNFTGADDTAENAIRIDLNAWLVSSGLFNHVVKITQLAYLDGDGDYSDTTYYAADETHLNAAGWAGIIPVFKRNGLGSAVSKFKRTLLGIGV